LGRSAETRLITPTGKDLVVPDNWLRVLTDKGAAAMRGNRMWNTTNRKYFIAKGEV